MSLYSKRGVSAQKEDVLSATGNLDKGLFPHSFCKVYGDLLAGDENWVNLMHADGAGTKSILAYLYWKETGDVGIWKNIAIDAIVMNLDDLICTGVYTNILFSSSIDRNKNLIPSEVLKMIIESTQEFIDSLNTYGIRIAFLGGETADVGDIVRTAAVNGTMASRWPKEKIFTNEKIGDGTVIIGLAGFGQTIYEAEYNSGIGSNGLTSARHDMLDYYYRENYPESVDPGLPDDVVYKGKYRLTDEYIISFKNEAYSTTIGKLLLSPTRTFAPVIKEIIDSSFKDIHGIVHSSGGGQTKCMKYMPGPMKIVKDNLFPPPDIFQLIKESSGADDREMYQVFNMGCRMEIYVKESAIESVIEIAEKFSVDARVIGKVEKSNEKSLLIKCRDSEIIYNY